VLRLAAAGLIALTCASPAAAHPDGGRGLHLLWPADGTVTRGVGCDGAEWHPGIDIGSLRSLDVTAAAAGDVVATGYVPGYDGYGQVVVVDLGAGLDALYAHLASVAVRVGERVETGDALGEAGCTGWCTGTHVHFELRDAGTPFDPAPLLPPGWLIGNWRRRSADQRSTCTPLARCPESAA
jgi:murein DD-endopeptidase MepM/ murein hydrolase activator NlpD